MLATLRDAGVFDATDVHLAATLARLGGDPRPEIALAAALASSRVRAGHVCVELGGPLAPPTGTDERPVDVAWPEPAAWRKALATSPLVSDGSRETPLVLDGARLYLRRYYLHERAVERAIVSRLSPVGRSLDAALLRDGLDRLFGADDGRALDPRRLAAIVALRRRFAVVAGGPGTGKTWTVVRLLTLLLEQAAHAGMPSPSILLLAPTGKAAARLIESIRGEKGKLATTDAIRAAIPDVASTIHRALRPIPGSSTRFRHHAGHPLAADVVLVDEASMVDVALMARLTDALSSDTRLILLGDPDQLASVEAGSLLGDLCFGASIGHVSPGLAAEATSLLGRPVEAWLPGPPIADAVVMLQKSRRFKQESGIGSLARAIREGRATDAIALCRSSPDLALITPDAAGMGREATRVLVDGYRPYLAAQGPVARTTALGTFRVLCAHRRGPWGVSSLNEHAERALAEADLLVPTSGTYDGRPILVTANDYALGLFNGDVGAACMTERGLRVAFSQPGAPPRLLSPSRLPPSETVLAMTIHKSQGSEVSEVLIVLPDASSPLLVRELLYTAVTRAKTRVTLVATESAMRAAIDRRVTRASGLGARLW